MFAESRKVNQACQSIWPEIDKGENKVKYESVSAGIPNISHTGISPSFADMESDKRIINAGTSWTSVSVGSADAENDKTS